MAVAGTIGAWIDRTIRGPAQEYMTADEFGKLFGYSGDFVRKLVADGEIPAPTQVSKQTFLYTWEAAVFYSLKLRFFPPALEEEGVKKKTSA